jgi:hypothetical protein
MSASVGDLPTTVLPAQPLGPGRVVKGAVSELRGAMWRFTQAFKGEGPFEAEPFLSVAGYWPPPQPGACRHRRRWWQRKGF